MVGNNNPFTTENTRKRGKTTVGEEMMGGWQVTPTVGFPCFPVFLYYRDYCLLPWHPVCMVIDLINLLFTCDRSIL